MSRRVSAIRAAVLAGLFVCAAPSLALAQAVPPAPAAPAAPYPPRAVAVSPAPTLGAAPAQRLRGVELRLRDLVGTIVIRPENRTDIAVSVHNPGPLATPEVRGDGRRVTINGKLRRRIQSCEVDGGGFEVTVEGYGLVRAPRLPVIEVRMPQSVVVNGNGAVRMRVARAESVTIRLEGCGEADLESVEGSANIVVAGDLSVRAYDVGEASVRVAGTGEVVLGVVREGLAASLASDGDLTAARVDGPTNIAVQGEGDVTIRSGRATVLSVVIAGSGDVTHNGSAERLDAVVVGDGDVRVRRVDGEVTRRVFGGGDVVVGRSRASDEAGRR